MAVIKYKVVEIIDEWDGHTCEVKAKVISGHEFLFPDFLIFSAGYELKVDQEFQDNVKIEQI